MDATALRALQAPLKQKYHDDPDSARIRARAEVVLDLSQIAARLPGDALRVAGLHRAAGGAGQHACSADMLLEALAACAGVTLMAVATFLGLPIDRRKSRRRRGLGRAWDAGCGQGGAGWDARHHYRV